jgi:hypothetical protein
MKVFFYSIIKYNLAILDRSDNQIYRLSRLRASLKAHRLERGFRSFFVNKKFLNTSRFFKRKRVNKWMWSSQNYYDLNFRETGMFLYLPNRYLFGINEYFLALIVEINKVLPLYRLERRRHLWWRSFAFFTYFNVYNEIYKAFQILAFRFFKLSKKSSRPVYHFIWNFKKSNLLFITLRDSSLSSPKNLTFTSLGLFTKFFEKKKAMKKNKLIKLLVIKYFRKLLVVADIWKIVLFVKKNPALLPELLNMFQQPVFLLDPNKTKKKTATSKIKFNAPRFIYCFFMENKSYVLNKLKKKGRIKRKITKKLVAKNKLTD